MITELGMINRKEELKELLWAEIFTKDDYWRKELSKQDKELLNELLEEFENKRKNI